jgi:sugar phosphate isomerase/epimerase
VIRAGIFARTFPRPTLGEALDAVAAAGVPAMQFNLALTGGPSLPLAVAPAEAEAVRAAVAARGLELAAVSGTWNMAHPDPAVREDGAARLAALVAAAPALGTRVVTLCTGTRDPADMWRAHPANGTPAAWRDLLEQLGRALAVAEAHGVVLAVEPEPANVVRDARAARRALDALASPHLKVVVDAANLVAADGLGRQAATLREAFALLGEDLVLAHAKDLRADGAVVAAGRGGLDYGLYVRLLREHGYDGPLVLHGLGEAEVPAAVGFLRRHLAAP